MKKGCLLSLVTWAVCGGAYWYYLHARFHPPLDWAVPAVAGLIMTVAVGNLRQGLGSLFSAASASRQSSFSGVIGEKPHDGEVVTVSGPIRAGGSSLRAPISDRPAVLYSYTISRPWQDGEGSHAARDFAGFGMAPAVIDSHSGAIRLLGFPTLKGFAREQLQSEANVANAQAYVSSTTFADMSGFNALGMISEVKDMLTDAGGQLRKDWRTGKNTEVGADALMTEQVVAPGEQVTAIGRYSAEKGGLIPDLAHPLALLQGDARASAASLTSKGIGAIFGALVLAALVNGALFGVLHLAGGRQIRIPKGTQETRADAEGLNNAARNGDIPKMEQLLARETPADARDAGTATPLMHAANAATASWLIAHGADVNAMTEDGDTALMEHARTGHADVVKVLVKSGARLDTVSFKWKSTALQQALDAEQMGIAQILRDAGAHDETVTDKNGHPIGASSLPAITAMAYLDAIMREDVDTMNKLNTRGPFKDLDFKTLKEARPLKPAVVSGFANEDAATVALRGKRADGVYTTWTYQLVHHGNAWQVSDERWETRLDSKER